jgi:hypothetical protein
MNYVAFRNIVHVKHTDLGGFPQCSDPGFACEGTRAVSSLSRRLQVPPEHFSFTRRFPSPQGVKGGGSAEKPNGNSPKAAAFHFPAAQIGYGHVGWGEWT